MREIPFKASARVSLEKLTYELTYVAPINRGAADQSASKGQLGIADLCSDRRG